MPFSLVLSLYSTQRCLCRLFVKISCYGDNVCSRDFFYSAGVSQLAKFTNTQKGGILWKSGDIGCWSEGVNLSNESGETPNKIGKLNMSATCKLQNRVIIS